MRPAVPGRGRHHRGVRSLRAGGVAEGAFRPLPDVGVAATMITHAVDGGLTALQRDPATDLGACADTPVPLLLAAVEAR